jgi:hypothetical protein
MNRRINVRFILGVIAAVAFLGARPSLAQDIDSDGASKPPRKMPQRDPAAAAFAIPYGTVLNDKQRSEYQRLKEDKESALREATDALDSATTPAEKASLRREINSLQHEIRAGVQQILMMPYHDAIQARQMKLLDSMFGGYGQAGYYSSPYVVVPGWYASYRPYYVYPWQHEWLAQHHHDRVSPSTAHSTGQVTNPSSTHSKSAGSTKAGRPQVAHQSTTSAASAIKSTSAFVARSASHAKTNSQPAKRH